MVPNGHPAAGDQREDCEMCTQKTMKMKESVRGCCGLQPPRFFGYTNNYPVLQMIGVIPPGSTTIILDGYILVDMIWCNPRFIGMTPFHLMKDDVKSRGSICDFVAWTEQKKDHIGGAAQVMTWTIVYGRWSVSYISTIGVDRSLCYRHRVGLRSPHTYYRFRTRNLSELLCFVAWHAGVDSSQVSSSSRTDQEKVEG